MLPFKPLEYQESKLSGGEDGREGAAPVWPARIRSLRRRQKRTLREVAEQCGFTESLLSKIESGKTTPPLATLSRIAAALGVGLSDLLDDDATAGTVHTAAARLAAGPQPRTAKGYGFHVLAAERHGKVMQPFLFVARRGEVLPGALTHAGEEFIYVLEGELRYRVGAVTYTLGPGDSLYFDSEDEHDFEPVTPEARFLGIFAERPPTGA